MQSFKEKDEDETGLTNISEVKKVIDEINKKAKEQGKAEPLGVVEVSDITKLITDKWGIQIDTLCSNSLSHYLLQGEATQSRSSIS